MSPEMEVRVRGLRKLWLLLAVPLGAFGLAACGPSGHMYPRASSQQVASGELVTVQVRVDTAGEAVMTTNANLAYDPTVLNCESVSYAGSSFQSGFTPRGCDKADGLLNLVAGQPEALTGDLLIGTVTFRGGGCGGSTAVSLEEESEALKRGGANVVGRRSGTTVRVQSDGSAPGCAHSTGPSTTSMLVGSQRGGSAADLIVDDPFYFRTNSTTSGTRTSSWYGQIQSIPHGLSFYVSYKGWNSLSCGSPGTQTVALYNFDTATWDQIDSRSACLSYTNQVSYSGFGLDPYVSGGVEEAGELRVRVRTTHPTTSFTTTGDLLRVVYYS